MATIGYTGNGGFSESPANNTQVLATKFTAPSSFTPILFAIQFSESWGVGGTCRVAIYSDTAGAPVTKLWEGSASYNSLHNGWLEIAMSSPPSLVSGTAYWLAVQWENTSGSFLIFAEEDSETGQSIIKWTEASHTWTDSPSVTGTVNNSQLSIYATDTVVTSSSRNAKAKGKATDSSNRPARTIGTGEVSDARNARLVAKQTLQSNRSGQQYGGYIYTHQDNYSTTDNKDAGASSNVEWTGDGEIRLAG